MQLIAFLLRSSPKLVAIAVFTGFLSGVSSAGLIALISRTLGNPNAAIGQIAGAFVGLAILSLVTSVISQVVLIRLAQDAVFDLRLQLSRQILSAELRHVEQLGNARIMATLTEDVQAVATAVSSFPFLCIDLATVVGCFVFIGSLSWVVFALVMGLFVFAVLACQWLLDLARRRMIEAREDQDSLFRHLRSITDGIKELKLHSSRRQVFLSQELETTSASFRRHNIDALILFATAGSWGKLIFFFAIGFVLFALPGLLAIPIATLSAYVLTFTYLMLPLDKIMIKLPTLSQASVSLQKIETLGLSLQSRTEAVKYEHTGGIAHTWKQIELRGVTHRYYQSEDTQFTLGEINLTLKAGEIVFIVGGNGSGKSTLAKLLTGLYVPESGTILLDGIPITDENREWYRQHCSTVFADFYLFDRLLGLETTDQEAQNYLQQLQLNHKVQIRNGELSTTELSQGQRKRLALLTAYLEDRPIYLFDEWASDQDPTFRELFYTDFLPKLKHRGKTVWVISHDDHYFGFGDRVIKLDYGRVEYDRRN